MDSSCNLGRLVAVMMMHMILWKASLGDPQTTVVRQFCNNNSVAVSAAVLADNFVLAMDNLSSQVNQNGFGTAVAGTGPNSFYALSQCYGDLSAVDCQLCFSEIRSLLPKCYPNTGGTIFLDGCFGRYENYSFFNQVFDSDDTHVCSSSNISSDPTSFSTLVGEAVSNVTSQALKEQGYAVGSASDSKSHAYALAQCWKNLNKTLCSSCLDAAASSIVSCTPATQGRALYAGCYVRYSTERFWSVNNTTSSSSGNHTNRVLWIILGIILLGGFLFIVGIIAWRKRGYWSKSIISLRDMYRPELSAAFSQSNRNFRYEELRRSTNNFNISNKLGQGSYGTVYQAVLSDGKEVAVKRLFLNTRQWVDQFFNEVDLINQVRHKNLVKLLGCSVDGPESLLVYEYYPNRSLDLFIFDENHDKHLAWKQRLDIIHGVAEGLSYLHEESETRIIHRDIKASNILLDEKFMPKITDFGLARSFAADKTHLSTGIAGTLGYMAPEYVVYGHLTEKADVFSYGVLILEIVTGKRCGSGIGTRGGNLPLAKIWDHHKTGTVEKLIEECIYKENMKAEILHIVQIGLFCAQANPHYRPTMAKVVELLRSSRNEEEVVLTDPPFLDVAMEDIDEGEASFLLPSITAPGLSNSSECQINGR